MLLPPRSAEALAVLRAIGVGVAIGVLMVVTARRNRDRHVLAGGELADTGSRHTRIGLYAAAMAGIGIALGGLVDPRFAAPAVLASRS